MSTRTEHFYFAHILRGLAALSVLLGHFWHNAWYMRPAVKVDMHVIMPPENVLPTPLFIKIMSSIPHFDWGALGVAIFFSYQWRGYSTFVTTLL